MKHSWRNKMESLSNPKLTPALKGISRGIEREALRISADSCIAPTAHPALLGSPLTHSWITTDYAEALMEFITPAGTNAEETLGILTDIHRHVYHHLGEELLWPASMPCTIGAEDDIRLAHYGTSNVGKMKTVYRRGLKNRYGSMMQIIAGVHYNFSMPDHFWPVWQQINGNQQPLQDFISQSYLGLIRNFFRLGWLIPYLFGASPAVDSSFLRHSENRLPLENLGQSSHYLPNATSLRLSDLGYNAKEQEDLAISYDNLSEFVRGLRQASNQSNHVFEKIGVKRHGEYQQLNTNTLQKEGEFYAPIRPKRVTEPGENLSDALEARGIEYIEVRSLDVNPYAEAGIDLQQMNFLDVFLTFCLLQDSPDLSRQEQRTAQQNLKRVAICGRDASLKLMDRENSRSLTSWAEDIFSELTEVAHLLDKTDQKGHFQAAVNCQHEKLTNPSLTPSARIIKDMVQQKLEVNELALNMAKKHRQKLIETEYMQIQASEFSLENAVSQLKQRAFEEEETLSYDEFHHLTFGNSPATPTSQRRIRGRLINDHPYQSNRPAHTQ